MEEHDDADLEMEKKDEPEHNFLNPNNLHIATFLPSHPDETIPAGFTIIQVDLDGCVKSDLNWSSAKQQAQAHISTGLQILWNIDLGLFQSLEKPIENQTQFLSITLSLEHFRDTIWKEFQAHTVGVCLYQGPLDFRKNFHWSATQKTNFHEWLNDRFASPAHFTHETGIPADSFQTLAIQELEKHPSGIMLLSLYCRDACTEYLTLLASHLPHGLPVVLLLDADPSLSFELEALLLHRERYAQFMLGVKNNRLPVQHGFIWTSHALRPSACERASIGICLPPAFFCKPSTTQYLETCLQKVSSRGQRYKIIQEEELTSEWDGLDYLLFNPANVTTQGKRKLQGFCAAGGTVVSFGPLLGLPGEISFAEFAV